jgi:hypothetical protein
MELQRGSARPVRQRETVAPWNDLASSGLSGTGVLTTPNPTSGSLQSPSDFQQLTGKKIHARIRLVAIVR